MSFRSILDSLTGKTYSSSVSIMEKTHFDGRVFQKVIDVKESAEETRRANKTINLPGPRAEFGYRFYFQLDLNAAPNKMSLRELAKNAFYDNYYSAHVQVERGGLGVTLAGPDDDGRRTCYMGYKLCDWLKIEPAATIDGEVNDWQVRQTIKVFPVTYRSIHEIHVIGKEKPRKVESINLFNDNVTVAEHEVNSYLRTIVRWEVNRFVSECMSIMSPRR